LTDDLDDDELATALGEALDDVAPIPPDLHDFAIAAFGWTTITGELARLVEEDREMAGTRGDSGLLTYEAGAAAVTVQFVDGELVGSLTPAGPATIDVVGADGTTIVVTADAHGRFRAMATTPFRLAVRATPAPFTTEWITA
jgi:hypothetical protein